MKTTPRIGAEHQLTFQVELAHTIAFEGLPPVLATPWLIWFMEHAALDLVTPHLDEGELTVGTRVEFDHQAPALEGEEVHCEARLILVDGYDLTFQVEATCRGRTLSRGLHRRKVVDRDRIRQRLDGLK